MGTLRMGGGMTTDAGNTDYLLDNADPRAERRFDALGQLFDTRTIEYLAAVGVTRGWSCWEAGAGGGSIAEWLAGAVAPTGSVLATDLDLGRLSATAMRAFSAWRRRAVHGVMRAGAEGRASPGARTWRTRRKPPPRDGRANPYPLLRGRGWARGVGAMASLVRANSGSSSNSRNRLSCLRTAG